MFSRYLEKGDFVFENILIDIFAIFTKLYARMFSYLLGKFTCSLLNNCTNMFEILSNL